MSLNKVAIKLINKYQSNKTRTPRCRHYPSCSNYGLECYKKFNFVKASFLTAFRIIRCNPFSKKYFDPVPLNKKEKEEYKIKLYEASIIDSKLVECFNKYKSIYQLIDFIYNDCLQDINEMFYYKVDRILVLIKEKKINLPYKKTRKIINDYLLHL